LRLKIKKNNEEGKGERKYQREGKKDVGARRMEIRVAGETISEVAAKNVRGAGM